MNRLKEGHSFLIQVKIISVELFSDDSAIFLILSVLTVLTTTIKYNEYTTDKGKNISIPCGEDKGTTMWIKQNGNSTDVIQVHI